MNTLEITRLSLRRFARDRTATFFVVILPVVVIVVIGATVRGFGDFRVAVVDLDGGPIAARVVRSLESAPGVHVTRFDRVDAARTSVRRAETSLAVVVPRGSAAPDADAIVAHCEGRLSRMKKPRSIDFVTALPINRNGKIDRRGVRETYWAGVARNVN